MTQDEYHIKYVAESLTAFSLDGTMFAYLVKDRTENLDEDEDIERGSDDVSDLDSDDLSEKPAKKIETVSAIHGRMSTRERAIARMSNQKIVIFKSEVDQNKPIPDQLMNKIKSAEPFISADGNSLDVGHANTKIRIDSQ